jgi:hypothetical protein
MSRSQGTIKEAKTMKLSRTIPIIGAQPWLVARGLSGLALIGLAGLVLMLGACTEKRELPANHSPYLESFQVKFADGFKANPTPPFTVWDDLALTLDIQAIGSNGQPLPTFNGLVRIGSMAAILSSDTNPVLRLAGKEFLVACLKDGKTVTPLNLHLTGAFGLQRLWVEYVQHDQSLTKETYEGLDDGFLQFKTACLGETLPSDDGTEPKDVDGNRARGASPALSFAPLTIFDLQHPGKTGKQGSPFDRHYARFTPRTESDYIVTAIAIDGFYMTDLGASDDKKGGYPYASLFVYTYSSPNSKPSYDNPFEDEYDKDFEVKKKVDLGRRVKYLQGSVNEYLGYTELSFPTWEMVALQSGQTNEDGLKDLPQPHKITATELQGAYNKDSSAPTPLEPYEAALNVVENAIPDFVECFNDTDCAGIHEGRCDFASMHSFQVPAGLKICTDGGFRQYGQWTLTLIDPKTQKFLKDSSGNKLSITAVTRDTININAFDPVRFYYLRSTGQETRSLTMTGTLRHVIPNFDYPGAAYLNIWIMQPRNEQDLLVQ